MRTAEKILHENGGLDALIKKKFIKVCNSRSRNFWLEWNLNENGIPFPGRHGMYLQPGSLILFSRDPEKERFALLLETVYGALLRSRRILFYSTRPAALIRKELTRLHCPGKLDPEIKRFRHLQADRFCAVQAGEKTLPVLMKEIELHLSFEQIGLCVIDADIFSKSRPGKIVSVLEERSCRNPEIIWLLASDSSPQWKSQGNKAAASLKLNRPEPANRENSISLFIA